MVHSRKRDANPGKRGVDNGVLSCDLIRILGSQPKLVGRKSWYPPLAGRPTTVTLLLFRIKHIIILLKHSPVEPISPNLSEVNDNFQNLSLRFPR